MSDVAIFNRPSRGLSQVALAGMTSQVARVSLNSNRFTLVDDQGGETPVNSLTMQVVFFDVAPANCKTYYDGPYNPANTDGPACFSDDGERPDRSSPKPQSETCAACPRNVWGSATSNVSGAAIKACSDGRKAAILVGGHGTTLYQLRIPPASLKNFAAYARAIGQQKVPGGSRSADLSDVITSVGFASQGVLSFEVVGNINGDIARLQDAVWADGSSLPLIGQPAPVKALPAPVPAPVQSQPAATFAAQAPAATFAAPAPAPAPVAEKRTRKPASQTAPAPVAPPAAEPFFPAPATFGAPAAAPGVQQAAPMSATPIFGNSAPAPATSTAQHAGVGVGQSPDQAMQDLLNAALGISTE